MSNLAFSNLFLYHKANRVPKIPIMAVITGTINSDIFYNFLYNYKIC